jgi:hypothetical protein
MSFVMNSDDKYAITFTSYRCCGLVDIGHREVGEE